MKISRNMHSIVIGNKKNVIQKILDFDYICNRDPSIVGIVKPLGETGLSKYFYGNQEILIPEYTSIRNVEGDFDVVINYSSYRSAYETTLDALKDNRTKIISIIAEGVPDREAVKLRRRANEKNIMIVGPASVGILRAGEIRIGDAGGDNDNIIKSKLYRLGSIGVVSKSGGMLNELFNMSANYANGISEGIAVGGEKFPVTTLKDHIIRLNNDENTKAILIYGEVGGKQEYEVADILNRINKPVIAWVSGISAKLFKGTPQFGHAGAILESKEDSAEAKREYLKDAGAIVPEKFEDMYDILKKIANELNLKDPNAEYRSIPLDFKVAVKKRTVRRPTTIISSIVDDRGEEPTYVGEKITDIIKNKSLGEVVGSLWLGKQIDKELGNLIEKILMLVADHGPSVSGAHNTIIATRAGKDLVSSLCSGLLTIGPRFGGAINDAAKYFREAIINDEEPQDFVNRMKKEGKRIPGIGHRIKSIYNPDKRVEILLSNIEPGRHLIFAKEVEKITTSKKPNLILNVDGAIAAVMLDELEKRNVNIDELIEMEFFNAFFVLGRSIGFIGHHLDQKRLKQGLYRHPWEDVLYLTTAKSKTKAT